MKNRFLLGTGYFNGLGSGSDWFFEHLWIPQIVALQQTDNKASKVIIIGVAGHKPPFVFNCDILELSGDLGHVHQHIGKKLPAKDFDLTSYEGVMLTLAMAAYTNECDLVFCEQDCLMFGDCIGQMYREANGRKMMFGKVKCMPCAQSIFLIKHDFILTFIFNYIALGGQYKLGEDKFLHLLHNYPEYIGQFSFGYDRDRPLNMDDQIWYSQKFTRHELLEMKRRGLISFAELPENVGKFTNDS